MHESPQNFESWMAGEHRWSIDVPGERVALLVVDMQNYACRDIPGVNRPPGRGIANFQRAIPGCVRLVEAARRSGHLVCFMRLVHFADNADQLPSRGRRATTTDDRALLVDGSFEADLIEELAPQTGEPVIDKARASSFYGTRLLPLLQAQGIDSVVICGVTTSICVEGTARDASQMGYDTYVVEDATGEFEASRHWHSLYTVDWQFGSVVTVGDVERSWGGTVALPTDATEAAEAGAR